MTHWSGCHFVPREGPWSQEASKAPPEENPSLQLSYPFSFLPACSLSPLSQCIFCFLFYFPRTSIILPLPLLFSVDFQSLIMALHIIFSAYVSSSIHYSPTLISQSPSYLGGRWRTNKTSFVSFCFQDKEN